jgi:hypothetical protein
MIRQLVLTILVLCAVTLLSCSIKTETQVVTGQVSRTTAPALSTGTVIVGNAKVSLPDMAATPKPGDTTFTTDDFPLWLSPTRGASMTINTTSIPERLPGIYFATMTLEFLHPYDLRIALSGSKSDPITAHAVLPDSFSITRPLANDSFGHDTIRVCWTKSDSAQTYTLEVTPEDTTSRARGYLESVNDTTFLIPGTAWEDSLSSAFLPGNYVIAVWAVNGGWKSGAALILNGGNVKNAVGLFGAATYPGPVKIILTGY